MKVRHEYKVNFSNILELELNFLASQVNGMVKTNPKAKPTKVKSKVYGVGRKGIKAIERIKNVVFFVVIFISG